MDTRAKAIDFINAIASNMTETKIHLSDILAVLEDGEALATLGADDSDTEMVEMAHAIVTEWSNDYGWDYLGQVQY